MSDSICLNAEELVELTGKVRPTAQQRELNAIGIDVRGTRSDGTLVVLRSAVDTGTTRKKKPKPNYAALSEISSKIVREKKT